LACFEVKVVESVAHLESVGRIREVIHVTHFTSVGLEEPKKVTSLTWLALVGAEIRITCFCELGIFCLVHAWEFLISFLLT